MKKFLFTFFLSLVSLTGYGWWDAGHMTVAKVAYDRLDPRVKEKVDHLSAEFAPFFPASADFVTAACWADDVVHEGIGAFFHWHGSARPFDPEGVLTDQKKEQLIASLEGRDIVWAVGQCMETLANPKASPWAQALMLRFLIHIVGDIHQPLHTATLFSSQFPNGDRAGTRFPLAWGKAKNSLHSYWDGMCGLGTALLDRPLKPDGEAYINQLVDLAITLYPENSFPELVDMDPDHWRADSYQLACKVAYQGIEPGASPSAAYEARGQQTACRQIALAGYRLAKLLNGALKQ